MMESNSPAASDSLTRPSLLLRLRDARDAQAWQTFVDVYGPLVFGHCRRRGLQHPDAQDVTQKVFAQVVQAIRSFEYRPEIGRFRDWLGTVVRHEIFRFLKTRERQAQGQGGSDFVATLQNVESRGEGLRVGRRFPRLVAPARLLGRRTPPV